MKRIFIIIIAVLTIAGIQAQDSLTREMTLEKDYNPSIRDANKINELPEIKSPEVVKSQVEFSNYTSPYSVSPYLVNIAPQSYFTDIAGSNKRGYLNLGVNSLLDIDGDIGYQILNTNSDFLSIYASNRYSNHDVDFIQTKQENKMKLHDIWGGINYKHTFSKAIVEIGTQYTYSKYNYYGLYPYTNFTPGSSTTIDKEFILNNFLDPDTIWDSDKTNNIFEVYTGIRSKEGDRDINYKVNVAYSNFKTKIGQYHINNSISENRIVGDFDLNKSFNSTWTLGVAGEGKVFFFSSDASKRVKSASSKFNDNYILSLNPYVTTEGTNWKARIGAQVSMLLNNSDNFNIAPDISFTYSPSETFNFYTNITGGVIENSAYSLFYQNRYLLTLNSLSALKSRVPIDGTIGINLLPNPGLTFNVFAGYKYIKDELFFMPNRLIDIENNLPSGLPVGFPVNAPNKYFFGQPINLAQYDAGVLKIGGSVNYKYLDLFSIGLDATYYNWNFSDDEEITYYDWNFSGNDKFGEIEKKAWNKPTFVGNLNIGYNVSFIPLKFNLNYHLESGRKSYINERSINMKDIHDLSLQSTYTLNESFSVSVSANNLLFQKYDLWHGYPAQSFNLMGGINVKF